jgi:drug/metabolite transporter superfamily protein YnfA
MPGMQRVLLMVTVKVMASGQPAQAFGKAMGAGGGAYILLKRRRSILEASLCTWV